MPVVVLVTGLAATLLAASFADRVVLSQQESRFREVVAGVTEALHRRMQAYVAKLRSTRGLVDVLDRDPTRAELREFVSSFEIPRFYRGIQGIGWAKALGPGEVAAHEAAMHAAGFPGYHVWPPGERSLHGAIVHLEPLDGRNEKAIGFDMFSEPTRRAAMERARDTGDVAASGKVLVQEEGEREEPGFLVYLPVYEDDPRTVEERRARLRGWVYAAFRTADLLEGAIAPDHAREIGFSVYDGPEPTPAALLYRAGGGGPERFAADRELEIGGRTWTLRFAASRAFGSRTDRLLPVAVLASGLAVALLLFWLVRADALARERAERSARRSSFLAEAGKLLSSSTEYALTLPDVAALAARRIADACLVYLLEPSGPAWVVGHGDAEAVRRVSLGLRGTGIDRGDALGAEAAFRTGTPQARIGLDAERLEALAAPLPAAAGELGARASLAIPLAARGEPLGAILLLRTGKRARFGSDDVALAEDLGRLVSSAVDASRLYRRAQEAVAARDEFLSIASHELKTPLTSLMLHSDSLRTAARRGGDAQTARKAETIRRNVERLSRLVESMLDISRIGTGRLDIELEDMDLAELVHEVVQRFQDEAAHAGCVVRVSATGPAVGRWDRMRLDQVVTNLLSNAIKYGPGKPVDVSVSTHGTHATLSVRDHGIGISEASQRRIFQRFERAVSKRNYGGFGLGLWIVRQIVEALGGTVRVESTPGEGSTFTVELNRTIGEAARGAPDDRADAPSP